MLADKEKRATRNQTRPALHCGRDAILVADLAAERARLGEANVMRFARRPAADNAGLRGYELAVLLVAQANGLPRDASASWGA